MNRYSIISISLFLLVACVAKNNKYNDEEMYDLAAKLKDAAQTVDGFIKFGDVKDLSDNELLQEAMKNNPQHLDAFKNYQLLVDIQGNNAVLMLCDREIALIEDAGCNLQLDKSLWQQTNHLCEITLKAEAVCR